MIRFGKTTAAHSATIYSLKPAFARTLRPFARWLAEHNFVANEVTISACLVSVMAGAALLAARTPSRWFVVLPIVLFVRMALNAVDGIMAREFQQQSITGAYLNELGDFVSDCFLILPFARLPGVSGFWIAALISLVAGAEIAGIIGATVGVGRRYEGPMGKSDRAVVFGAIALWFGAGGPLSAAASMVVFAAIMILLILTIWNRMRSGMTETGS